MPFVRIHREKQFADAARAYKIYLDGEEKGEIRRDSTEEFFIPEGTHRIFLKIDWCGSPETEFNAATEEFVEFNCGNNTKLILALFYILFSPNEYLWLKKR